MNNQPFIKLAEEIQFEITENFKQVKLEKAQLIDGIIFDLIFSCDEILNPEDVAMFFDKLNTNFKYKTKFQFNVTAPIFEIEKIKAFMSLAFSRFFKKPLLAASFKGLNISVEGKEVSVEFKDTNNKNTFESLKEKLTIVMRRLGYEAITFTSKLNTPDDSIFQSENLRLREEAARAFAKPANQVVEEKTFKRANGYEKVSIKDLKTSMLNNVLIHGEVFKVEQNETKTGMIITTLSITDYEDAIYVKLFAKSDKDKEEHGKYFVGQYLEISGAYQIDSYTKEPTILARKIVIRKSDDAGRTDMAEVKRVELAARTRMSTMDGIVSAKQLVDRAIKWGHKAITVIDADSVQAFPEFYNSLRGKDLKGIFGSSFSVIEKNSGGIYWPQNKPLEDDTYVVFDLETTGLSPEFEDMIEFGATKVIGTHIVERKQFFIKPTKSIPQFITDITSITNEMVADAKPESEAILDIKEYIGDATLVAHNANFDITFINAKLVKYGHQPLTNPTIDSLAVARMVQPKSKKYRLESVANRYNVTYDTMVAHRADYDADVLARVWLRMLVDLKELNVFTQQDLYDYTHPTMHEKKFNKEISIIAKNQKGLKKLFQLSSKALTEQFFRGPKLFVEDLKHDEDLLIGSGALKSRLVDRMLFGSKEQVKEEIAIYDYIEIQPLKNFAHVINRGFDENNLKEMIKFVIEEAKRQNKIVVATGDVRYLDKKDKLYHEVYINAKGLGGARHYLFKFNEENPVYPSQEMLTTKEMMDEFQFLEDPKLVKELVVENSNKIADMIEDVQVIKDKLYTPTFGDSDESLESKVYENAKKKYGENLPTIVENRIKKEIEPIKKYGFSVIYWISHLLVGKSLDDGYLVGSRGSVGSSFVATMAEITEVNPLQPHYVCDKCQYSEFPEDAISLNSGYDLPNKSCPECSHELSKEGQNIPFETFLGFEANKVPDIDLNFSGEYQPIIHNEVKRLFGDTHSFRAGTISTVAEKTAFGYVKAWAEETGKDISKAFVEFIAKGVAGTKRTTGQHPGGIIVIPKEYDVEDFTPVNYPANDVDASWKTTHFDFHAIHDNVLKLDLLGHDDPTAIKYLEKLTGIKAKDEISFSDEKIISLFSSPEALGIKPEDINGETTGAMGIPEFGTKFVRGMLKNAKVQSFGDLIAVSGLSHGTDVWANNAEQLVRNKGLTLAQVISCRDNIMTDLMNKKLDPLLAFEIMEKVRKGKGVTKEQEDIMKKHGVEDWYIDSLKKIKYMFPKAHATAYVMMAWRIAWFKLYRPLAYYATYFTTRSDVFDIHTILKGPEAIKETLQNYESRRYKYGEDKLSNKEADLIPIFEIALEAIARGFTFANIDLNRSQANEWIIDNESKTLIPPFSSLDGLGTAVAESIVRARKDGEFTSIEDLKNRSSINKTSIEHLKELGVLKHLSNTNQISFDLF